VRAELLDYAERFRMGRDVSPFKFLQHVETEGLLEARLYVGRNDPPASDAPLVIQRYELATFDTANLDFVRG
jgi:hypothetical protein